MSESLPNLLSLKNIDTHSDSCTIRVQVIRMWSIPDCTGAEDFISIDMVLFDCDGTKIQASLRHSIVSILHVKLSEGAVYEMSGFEVIPNNGSDRVTNHSFRLMLTSNSTVKSCAIDKFTHYGFSPISAKDIFDIMGRKIGLVDVVGVLTGVSSEKHYLTDFKICTMMFLELCDHTGRVEVVVYVEYAEYVREYLRCHGRSTPIIVIQFVKILPFGRQMFAWYIFFCAKITDILDQTPWWSVDPRRIKADYLDPNFDLNFDSPDIMPRYNINVEVSDGVDVTYLTLCDADVEGIVNIPCKAVVLSLEDPYSMDIPEILNDLVGRDYLFMVEKSFNNCSFEGNVKVIGIFCDPEIVEIFLRLKYNFISDVVHNKVHCLLSTMHNCVYVAESENDRTCSSSVINNTKAKVSKDYTAYVQQRPLKRNLVPEFEAESSHQDVLPNI